MTYTEATSIDWHLAMHLISEHCNSAAVASGWKANAESHQHEHFGPGGIRNHPAGSLAWDEDKIEQVLAGAEEDEAPLAAGAGQSFTMTREEQVLCGP